MEGAVLFLTGACSLLLQTFGVKNLGLFPGIILSVWLHPCFLGFALWMSHLLPVCHVLFFSLKRSCCPAIPSNNGKAEHVANYRVPSILPPRKARVGIGYNALS